MKVRMIAGADDAGWHDGEQWRSYPPSGEVLETSDAHGAELCAQGKAVPVTEKRSAETRPAPDDAEKRAAAENAKAERDKAAADAAAKAEADQDAADDAAAAKSPAARKPQAGKS